MSNPADEHIVNLIEELAREASRYGNFQDEAAYKQTLIDQIATLRASMNPVIHQYVKP